MMGTKHSGYFAIPAEHVGEIRALYEAWGVAVDELQEDSAVPKNRLYDRAVEVAAYHRSLVGWVQRSAFAELGQVCFEKLWKRRQIWVFSPEDCQLYYERLLALEERLGGEFAIAKLAEPIRGEDTLAIALEVYRMFKDVLGVAAERGLGFAEAGRNDDAEAELAEARRQREERRRNHEESLAGRPPQPIEEIRAELAAWRERFHTSSEPMSSATARETTRQAVLCLLSDADADEIRALLFEVNRLWAEEHTSGRVFRFEQTERTRKAHWLAYQRATSGIALPHRGEAASLDEIVRSLRFECFERFVSHEMTSPRTVRAVEALIAYHRERPDRAPPPSSLECCVFSSRQAAILRETLTAWVRERGRKAVLADMLRVHRERALAESALTALETALEDADRQGLALVYLSLDRDQFALASAPEPPPPPVR